MNLLSFASASTWLGNLDVKFGRKMVRRARLVSYAFLYTTTGLIILTWNNPGWKNMTAMP